MEKVTVIVISEDGSYLDKETIDLLLQPVEKKYEIANAPALNHVLMKAAHETKGGIKNAHNDALYLMGAIEESEYPVIVIAWDEDETGFPKPRYLAGEHEISRLMAELDKNKETDSWVTAIRLNREIRGH